MVEVPYSDQAAQTLLASIIEHSHDAILRETLTGRILDWNKAAERIFGYSAAEMLGQSVGILVLLESTHEFSQNRDRLKAGQRVEEVETVRLTKEGKRIEVLLTLLPMKDQAGNQSGAVAIIHDISQRKEAAATHRNREALFRQFARQSRKPSG